MRGPKRTFTHTPLIWALTSANTSAASSQPSRSASCSAASRLSRKRSKAWRWRSVSATKASTLGVDLAATFSSAQASRSGGKRDRRLGHKMGAGPRLVNRQSRHHRIKPQSAAKDARRPRQCPTPALSFPVRIGFADNSAGRPRRSPTIESRENRYVLRCRPGCGGPNRV